MRPCEMVPSSNKENKGLNPKKKAKGFGHYVLFICKRSWGLSALHFHDLQQSNAYVTASPVFDSTVKPSMVLLAMVVVTETSQSAWFWPAIGSFVELTPQFPLLIFLSRGKLKFCFYLYSKFMHKNYNSKYNLCNVLNWEGFNVASWLEEFQVEGGWSCKLWK